MISQKNIHIITQTDLGGAQKYVLNCARNDQQKDIPTLIVSEDNDDWLYQQAKLLNIPYKVIHNLRREITPWKDFLSTVELIRLIHQEQPTHLFLNSSKMSVIGAVAGKICGVKNIIYTVHGWVFNEPMSTSKHLFYLWLEKMTAPLKNKIYFVNDYDRQIAIENKIGHIEQYVRTELTVDEINFYSASEARAKLFTFDTLNKKIIGTIANTYPTKNLSKVIELANHFKQRDDLLFVIIGDGPEQMLLQQKITQLELKNIILLGQINDAAQYLKAFDLFILTSVKEGSPYVLQEAKQAGIPILATPVGGVPEMLPPEELCALDDFATRINERFGMLG